MIDCKELAIEAMTAKGRRGNTSPLPGGLTLTEHDVQDGEARAKGCYLTIALPQNKAWDGDVERSVTNAFRLLEKKANAEQGKVLLVGLGNRNILCDRLGTDTVDCIEPTDRVRLFCPMVYEQTGMETADVVQAVSEKENCALVVAVDALVCRSPERLMRTVELSDAGIAPGGGVGLSKKGLNKETLGVPVVYIGVPMLSFVDPFYSTLCVTTQDIQKKSVVIAQTLANALRRALA